MPINVEPLLAHVPVWLLVLFRLTGIFIFAPVLGSRTIPGQIKIFLALALSFCIYPMLWAPASPSAALLRPILESGFSSLWTLGAAVAMELTIGLLIGFAASLPLIGIQLGGRVMDQQMGLGLAGVLNPVFDEQTGIVSEFYFILALVLFVILGGHRVMLAILIGSFNSVPLGGMTPDAHLANLLVGLLQTMYELAFRVAAPLLCIIFLETIAMGFIARTVPQMNILSIGFALRIMVGAIALIGAITAQADVFVEALQRTLQTLETFFGM